jgi:hypothetical protein
MNTIAPTERSRNGDAYRLEKEMNVVKPTAMDRTIRRPN